MYSSVFSLTSALFGSGWWTPRPGHFTPGKETQYPLYRKVGGPQGRSRRAQKLSPPKGLNPWTVQPLVSCYTDWATAEPSQQAPVNCLNKWQILYFGRCPLSQIFKPMFLEPVLLYLSARDDTRKLRFQELKWWPFFGLLDRVLIKYSDV